MNDGRGIFATSSSTLPQAPAGSAYSGAFDAGDFDGDGLFDWFASRSTTPPGFTPPQFIDHRVLIENGNGTLTDLGPALPAGVQLQNLGPPTPVMDLDNDGDGDLLAPEAARYFNGNGTLTTGSPVYPEDIPMEAADGNGDFVARSVASNPGIALGFRGDGNGGFTAVGIDSTPWTVQTARIRNLDGDSDLNLIMSYQQTFAPSAVHLVENLANSQFTVHDLPLGAATGVSNIRVGAGDVDGDGLIDIVMGSPSAGAQGTTAACAVFRRSSPAFTFEAPRVFVSAGFEQLLDADNDGDPDIAGGTIHGNRRFTSQNAGYSRQFRTGSPGTAGFVPILGVMGPIRVGLAPAIRVRRGLGGAASLLALGFADSAVAYPSLGGIVS